jgi:hypothetical protein
MTTGGIIIIVALLFLLGATIAKGFAKDMGWKNLADSLEAVQIICGIVLALFFFAGTPDK